MLVVKVFVLVCLVLFVVVNMEFEDCVVVIDVNKISSNSVLKDVIWNFMLIDYL